MMVRGWRRYLTRRVLVNLKDGQAVAGVLTSSRGGVFSLSAATLYVPGKGAGQKMEGEVAIPEENVSFMQVIPPEVWGIPAATSSPATES